MVLSFQEHKQYHLALIVISLLVGLTAFVTSFPFLSALLINTFLGAYAQSCKYPPARVIAEFKFNESPGLTLQDPDY